MQAKRLKSPSEVTSQARCRFNVVFSLSQTRSQEGGFVQAGTHQPAVDDEPCVRRSKVETGCRPSTLTPERPQPSARHTRRTMLPCSATFCVNSSEASDAEKHVTCTSQQIPLGGGPWRMDTLRVKIPEPKQHICPTRIVRKIGPFSRISQMVVELLAPVSISCIAPVF